MSSDAELAALLGWYVEAGADEAVAEAPVNRYETVARAAAAQAAPDIPAPEIPAPEIPANVLMSRKDVTKSARSLASEADSLEALETALAGFEGCPLKQTASSLVFGDGDAHASLMLVGEAPGAEEDRRGVPFVGPAGRLLDLMLGAIGMERSTAYITNILPWRPPGNRTPTDAEIAACLPFIERHIELVSPDILVVVGGTAAKTLLGARDGIMKLRGRWFKYESAGMVRPIPARAILHPAYLLRSPAQKRETWIDLIAIKHRLAETAHKTPPN